MLPELDLSHAVHEYQQQLLQFIQLPIAVAAAPKILLTSGLGFSQSGIGFRPKPYRMQFLDVIKVVVS